MDEITDLLSEKRLAKYKDIGKENAIACHLFNCELAESFYSSLSYFEIILRNKIHHFLFYIAFHFLKLKSMKSI